MHVRIETVVTVVDDSGAEHQFPTIWEAEQWMDIQELKQWEQEPAGASQ